MKTDPPAARMGDFTADRRMILLSALALGLGLVGALLAVVLLRTIDLFTNLFFFHRLSFASLQPFQAAPGPGTVVAPVVGGLIIGLMARFGSEKIRGHGIPEALEAILIRGSRVEPRVAWLKPLSSAISIGSGGPFGAEGPIIMTGGACGSVLAQTVHLSSAERKTLLVAGAAAGMSATFAAPLASVCLAVELLLLEWKPRSLVPVALASAVAAVARRYLLGEGPLFPMPVGSFQTSPGLLLACAVAGLLSGALALLLTRSVYAVERAFARLPVHWMWWPALGGLVVGLGGLLFPPALGVGYQNIADLLGGDASLAMLAGLLLVKSTVWIVALGSGTSGGVLAPMLMLGGALGGLESAFLPQAGPGFWPLIGLGSILGGTMRSPLTGVVFALELTGRFDAALPLLVACVVAYAFTVLAMPRSILTEKVALRGYHVSREYSVDPLEILFVAEVMRRDVVTLSLSSPAEVPRRGQRLYPVVDGEGRLLGVVRRRHADDNLAEAMVPATEARPGETLRAVAERMASCGLTTFPVVDDERRVIGLVGLEDLLKGRARNLEAEERRETFLRLPLATR